MVVVTIMIIVIMMMIIVMVMIFIIFLMWSIIARLVSEAPNQVLIRGETCPQRFSVLLQYSQKHYLFGGESELPKAKLNFRTLERCCTLCAQFVLAAFEALTKTYILTLQQTWPGIFPEREQSHHIIKLLSTEEQAFLSEWVNYILGSFLKQLSYLEEQLCE